MIQKLISILTYLLVAIACNGQSNPKTNKVQKKSSSYIANPNRITSNSITEEKIYDSLFKLPEVQTLQRRIDSMTNHKHGVSFMLDTILDNVYVINTGYNGELRFENDFTFYVSSKTFEIKIYDFNSDSVISLSNFRKINK